MVEENFGEAKQGALVNWSHQEQHLTESDSTFPGLDDPDAGFSIHVVGFQVTG